MSIRTSRYALDPATGLTQVLSEGANTDIYGNGRPLQYQSAKQYLRGRVGGVRQRTRTLNHLKCGSSWKVIWHSYAVCGDRAVLDQALEGIPMTWMRRHIVVSSVLGVAVLCVILGLWDWMVPEILTRQHGSELRPVMERYFAVAQEAHCTLDLAELETVMTPKVADYWRYIIYPDAKIHVCYDSVIANFGVLEYSATQAKVWAIELGKNISRVDDKTGERATLLDEYDGIYYTLTKIDGVWIVSGQEAMR